MSLSNSESTDDDSPDSAPYNHSVETNIFAISSEGGHVIYHVSNAGRPLSKKVTEELQTLLVSNAKVSHMRAPREATLETEMHFDKVDPRDVNLRVNPFGSGMSVDGSEEGGGRDLESSQKLDFGGSFEMPGGMDAKNVSRAEDVQRILNARRLTRETCRKEKIFFDDEIDGLIEPTDDTKKTTDLSGTVEKNKNANAGEESPHGSVNKSRLSLEDVSFIQDIVDEIVTDAVFACVEADASNEQPSAEKGTQDSIEGLPNGKTSGITTDNLRNSSDQVTEDVKKTTNGNSDAVGVEHGNCLENSSDMESGKTNGEAKTRMSRQNSERTSSSSGADDRSSPPPSHHPHKLDTELLPTVHPLHTHILLYTQKYDAKRTLYAFQCIKAMLGTSARHVTYALTTANIGGATTPHISRVLDLLVRHRRSVFGKNFHGDMSGDVSGVSSMRSSMFVEVLVSVCLYYIRSYYPNLMMSKLSDSELTANKDIQILSCDILNMLLAELISITRSSGRGFATYIGELLSKCKVQKAVMYLVLSSVYNTRQHIAGQEDSVNLTEAIISFNDEATEVDSNETLQIRLLKLLLSVIVLEDQVRRSTGDQSSVSAPLPPEWDALSINATLASCPSVDYQSGRPVVYQPMLLLSIVSMLKQQHMSHMHRHWLALVISATPYLHRALTKVTLATVYQLCRNVELLAQLYELGHVYKSLTYQPDKIPPDHIVTLLEALTTVCHHCLLDSCQQPVDLSTATVQSLPDCTVGTSSYRADPPVDEGWGSGVGSGLLNNLAQSLHLQSGGIRDVSPLKDSTCPGFSSRLETKAHLLNILPRILASLTVLWRSIHVSETKDLSGETQPWWTLGSPKAVRQCILEFISPLALHHTQHMLAAVAVVWNERRQKGLGSAVKRVIPAAGMDQLLLVDLVSAVKLLPIDTVIQTVKQIIKQPPLSGATGGETTGQLSGLMSNQKSGVPLEVGLLRFLYAYIQRVEGGLLIDTWPLLLSLLRDGLQINLVPPGLFVLLAILSEFLQKMPMFEERKDQKDLQEITQRLLEACSEVAGSSLEQITFFRRNLAVKPGPQRDVTAEMDDLTTDLEHDAGRQRVGSMSRNTSGSSSGQTTSSLPADSHQYSVQALVLLTDVTATLLDVVYKSEEKEQRVIPLLNNILCKIFPYLKNHSLHNLPSFRACSQFLASLSSYQYTRRAWKREVFELLVDPSFFQTDEECIRSWMIIIDNLMSHDRITFKDLITRINVTQGTSLNLFSSKEAEFEQRAQLLKRLSFTLFCSEPDQYQKFMPDIQEKLADCLRLPMILSLQAQVFLCFRVLLLRMSPQYLTSLWPTIITELVQVMLQIEQELTPDEKGNEARSQLSKLDASLWHSGNATSTGATGPTVTPAWLQLYLHACKLLDLALTLPADTIPQFQLYRWAFVGDGGGPTPDMDKRRHTRDQPPNFVPHVVKIARLIKTKFGDIPLLPRASPPLGSAPLLTSPYVGTAQDLCSFFTTIHAILQHHGGQSGLTNGHAAHEGPSGGAPGMEGSQHVLSKAVSLSRSVSAPDVSMSRLGVSGGHGESSRNKSTLSDMKLVEQILLRDMLEYIPSK